MTNHLIVSDHPIPVDANGRVNLNALHKLSGLGEHKRPSKWLATKTTKMLIRELSQSPNSGFGVSTASPHSGSAVISIVQGGINPSTYAHELLAVSYAGWISPKFQLMVNQAFIDARKVDAVTVVPAYIRQELLKCNPLWQQIQRYYALHLTQVEMSKLLSCSASHIRDQLKRMARCGLIDYQPNPELSKAGRKAYLMLVNGR